MVARKRSIVFVLIVVVSIALAGCNTSELTLSRNWKDFCSTLEMPNLNGLTLRIYYVTKDVLFSRGSIPADELMFSPTTESIFIDNHILMENTTLINQLKNTTWKIKPSIMPENARICYVFDSNEKNQRFIFSISGLGCGDYENYYLNGISVEYAPILFDILKTFAPDDLVQELKSYFPSARVDGSLSWLK